MPAQPYDANNVFAKILAGELPCQKVYEDAETLVIMDIMPRADGHILVIPKAHARNMLDISENALTATMRTVRKITPALMSAMQADGLTIQQFNETAGGQVVFHLHVHMIPRWNGVALRPHTGEMATQDALKSHAERIIAAIGNLYGAEMK